MINATFEIEDCEIKRIFAHSNYPSEQRGNVFYDSEIPPDLKFADELPAKLECLHSVIAFRPSHILLSRDILGGKPLYYSRNGISSFKFMLNSPTQVLPGEVLKLDYNGNILRRKIYSLEEVIGRNDLSIEEIEETIEMELGKKKVRNGCIAFSGGLDSALIASMHDLPLIAVTASDKDEEWLKKAAKMISRDLEIKRIKREDIESILKDVPNIIEDFSFLQLSIAIPFYFLFSFAKEMGYSEVVLGQGADELFGGYKRYEKLESLELENALLNDLRKIGEKNIVRDTKISYYFGIRLVLPYLNWNVIRCALSIPTNLKVARINGKSVRKYFLRKIAEKYLPREMVWREKKAIQYSTGVAKILKKIIYSQTGKAHGF